MSSFFKSENFAPNSTAGELLSSAPAATEEQIKSAMIYAQAAAKGHSSNKILRSEECEVRNAANYYFDRHIPCLTCIFCVLYRNSLNYMLRWNPR